MDVSSKGYKTHARRHNLGHIAPVQYALVLVREFFITVQFITTFLTVFFFAVKRHPQVELEEFSFLERIFAKTKPEERTWVKLVTLNTIHWYCDELEPTPTAIKYDAKIRRRKSVVLVLFERFSFLSLVINFIRPPLQKWTMLRGGQ